MRALRSLSSLCLLLLFSSKGRLPYNAALADLTLDTIIGVIGNFNTSIPAMQIASYTTNIAKVSQSNIPDYTNSLTFA